jgi:putative copper export protein
MAIEQAILTWVHITCAAIWVGGSLFIGAVFAPILKKMSMPVEERLQLMIKVGRRFNKIAVPALIVLMGTGIYQAHLILQKSELLVESSYGNILAIKIILVVALIVTFAIHVRVIRKDVEEKIMSKQISDDQLQVLRKKIIILGEITVVLSIIILFLAAVLNSGGQF